MKLMFIKYRKPADSLSIINSTKFLVICTPVYYDGTKSSFFFFFHLKERNIGIEPL